MSAKRILNAVDSPVDPTQHDSWGDWRQYTQARIALGRSGESLPSEEVLKFGLAHAQARDAIHTPLDTERLTTELKQEGWDTRIVRSQATDRTQYLVRPDLGRRLAVDSALLPTSTGYDVGFVVGDGLSSLAVQRQVVPFLQALKPMLAPHLTLAPVVVATQARVALADEVGEQLGLRLVVMLIGERPGLSSPDSLGVYLTYGPKVGKHDAERNCISNVRPEGLDYPAAAFKLNWLIEQALSRQLTGVNLKDESDLMLRSHQAHLSLNEVKMQ
ncbi:ethanolamine ammonia-lyase subunit EutC [Aquirhabdus parva]|uniref:Ethanolamine ammonia-lyase small subunit n=1 Tax=Aquirhabdus parva TaxID=2283318 RepID=A0A345P2I9_9GAMM|nr:ethanolamine ammonia-lyase subunit EutC [Aquirhabdus parva]AXI01498.1 ethanolamine ammonia-lyase subunit EutC [Aquirhabdus parva]